MPHVPPPGREGAFHVGMPLPGWKLDLRTRAAHPPEQVADGKTEFCGQQLGLIEATPVAPRPVQRHRQRDVRTGQYVCAMMAHQAAKSRGDRLAPAVLERMDDVTQRPVVTADGAGAIDGAWTSRAASAYVRRTRVGRSLKEGRGIILEGEIWSGHCFVWTRTHEDGISCSRNLGRVASSLGRFRTVTRPGSRPDFGGDQAKPAETLAERRQGVTAPIADGWCARPDRRPATLANGAAPEMLKNRAAGGARRREQHQRSGLGRSREAAREAPPRVRQARRAR